MTLRPSIRCAVYTRKSTEDGLDQEFNSLDAQYEACTAYISSQKHEGWKLVADRFDDGGISGATLERPAVQRLLAEIDAGRVGMVVVYKIDRLTRSLADFVRLVERLDAKGCSFVSVTQAFNTSSSMGRLTLNVLLSFAQFEREVTAERIRDKIAASKKKGLWMGGSVPLGYDRHPDPQRRELVVNEGEAATVLALFELYARLGNLRLVEKEAERLRLCSRSMRLPDGTYRPPAPFSRGQLHYLLTNPVYNGRIRHKEKDYPGLHAAIINSARWDEVQAKLVSARARPRGRTGASGERRSLTRKVRDETGDVLTPTHCQRHGRRFSYYVSHRLIAGGKDASGWRLPAEQLETAVGRMVCDHLRCLATSQRFLSLPEAEAAQRLSAAIGPVLKQLKTSPTNLTKIVQRINLTPSRADIHLDATALACLVDLLPSDLAAEVVQFTAPFALARRGIEMRIVAGQTEAAPDDTLIRVLADARSWARALQSGTSLNELVRISGYSEPYLRARLPLAFLAPKLQQMILEGRQPPDLTVARFVRERIPLDWAEQERLFGRFPRWSEA